MNEVFEDKREDLDQLLLKYRPKWQLSALAWLDYDDVCQIIRLHIYNKWHLWDQSRPFRPWASMIISNQIKNLIRNNYTSFAKPCLRCKYNMGGTLCDWTKSGDQDRTCADFDKWKRKKERAYNIKLPLALDEGVATQNTSSIKDQVNYPVASSKLHELVMTQLSERHKAIYVMIYIEHKDESDVAKRFGFKGDSTKRKTIRYKQISNLKKKFYRIALKIMEDHDIL
jgi:RNA polymerase sigma factor (sigma-70 family)